MSDFKYYVYEHRTDDGEVFYVGKGCGNRAWEFGRNKLWNRVAKKHGWHVGIVRDGMREHEAHSLERELIAMYGRRDLGLGALTNLTDGGEGTSGLKRDKEKMRGTWNKRLKDEGLGVISIEQEYHSRKQCYKKWERRDATKHTLRSTYEPEYECSDMWEALQLGHRATAKEAEIADRARGAVFGLDSRGRPKSGKTYRKPREPGKVWRARMRNRIIGDIAGPDEGPRFSPWSSNHSKKLKV